MFVLPDLGTEIMKIDKPLENWTKFPNCILDNIDKFKPIEFKILGLMVRKNIGYSRPNKQFSVNYLAQKLGHSRNSIIKSINSLIDKQSVVIISTDLRGCRLFDINWREPVQKMHQSKIDRCKICTSTGAKNEPVLVQKMNPLKDNSIIRKQVLKENSIDRDAKFNQFWDAYDKKVARPKCYKKFISLKDSDINLILENVSAYVASTPDKKFRKNPLTYLNNASWQDEILSSQAMTPFQQTTKNLNNLDDQLMAILETAESNQRRKLSKQTQIQ